MKTLLSVLLQDATQGFIYIGIIIGVSLLIFMILRDVVLWYYKIGYRIKLQEEMNENLRRLLLNKGIEPAYRKGDEKTVGKIKEERL